MPESRTAGASPRSSVDVERNRVARLCPSHLMKLLTQRNTLMPTLEQLSDQLNSGDQPTVYRAKRALEEMAATAGAPGNNDQRQTLAAALAKAETAQNEKGDAP